MASGTLVSRRRRDVAVAAALRRLDTNVGGERPARHRGTPATTVGSYPLPSLSAIA
jgi:hypothetical protein